VSDPLLRDPFWRVISFPWKARTNFFFRSLPPVFDFPSDFFMEGRCCSSSQPLSICGVWTEEASANVRWRPCTRLPPPRELFSWSPFCPLSAVFSDDLPPPSWCEREFPGLSRPLQLPSFYFPR